MNGPVLTRLEDPERGLSVICSGHVSEIAFARRLDVDDVARILGEHDTDAFGVPTDATDERIAERVRHTWGRWGEEGGRRRWGEASADEPGAEPFTVVDENSRI